MKSPIKEVTSLSDLGLLYGRSVLARWYSAVPPRGLIRDWKDAKHVRDLTCSIVPSHHLNLSTVDFKTFSFFFFPLSTFSANDGWAVGYYHNSISARGTNRRRSDQSRRQRMEYFAILDSLRRRSLLDSGLVSCQPRNSKSSV